MSEDSFDPKFLSFNTLPDESILLLQTAQCQLCATLRLKNSMCKNSIFRRLIRSIREKDHGTHLNIHWNVQMPKALISIVKGEEKSWKMAP